METGSPLSLLLDDDEVAEKDIWFSNISPSPNRYSGTPKK